MDDPNRKQLHLQDLIALAAARNPGEACAACAALVCLGWESLPGGFDTSGLVRVGTLRQTDDDEEPTLEEYHPRGTRNWSADAPIAPAFFPYNRCDAWQCRTCARPFLRYTEYGGYYQDERIRELQAALLDDAVPGGKG
ncbi:hypothetical protein SNE35_18550 [Paucibacter sp. R3-3]|uniref:Uncharacterized protein n=1 Tax=Roseateles agri TaxID=3098619 RepID=A0ABU5DLG3_9BURK|nr:hypothetical protein [Paucibacter sp. R3-3]MDY0746520.1 hypothetical protein [Paucibacter sp. R3-3]